VTGRLPSVILAESCFHTCGSIAEIAISPARTKVLVTMVTGLRPRVDTEDPRAVAKLWLNGSS
jgi:hypothetical protein